MERETGTQTEPQVRTARQVLTHAAAAVAAAAADAAAPAAVAHAFERKVTRISLFLTRDKLGSCCHQCAGCAAAVTPGKSGGELASERARERVKDGGKKRKSCRRVGN